MLPAFATGLVTGLSLIVAIGAQNAFVLRQGLRRERVALVVAICALSDVVLIFAGVAGIGVLVERAPVVLDAVRWLGVAFLTAYGLLSLWRARRPEALGVDDATPARMSSVATRGLALTWLNPHVYLDTVVLLGSVAATHGPGDRWWFGAGASAASMAWFSTIAYGAGRARRLLTTPRAWQVLDVLIGLTMLGIAASLARG